MKRPHYCNRVRINPKFALSAGFSLIELMTVMAVMATMLAISTPVISALKGSGDFYQASYQVAGSLEQARGYAIANNTYVYVGLTETSAANPSVNGQGRLTLVLMASRDGTRGYDLDNVAGGWKSIGNLTLLSKPIVLINMHLVSSSQLPDTGALKDRPDTSVNSYDLGAATSDSATPFAQKVLGNNYTFSKVIQFDPQGVARVQTSTSGDEVPLWIEIAVQQTKGEVVYDNAPEGAIQVAGVSGSVKVYRP